MAKSGFQKGHEKHGGRQKGTPNKSTAEVKAYCQEFGEDIISMLLNLAHYSIDPRVRIMAGKEILDRGYGRPPQGVELSGPDGGPIVHKAEDMSDKEAARISLFYMLEADDDKPELH